MTKIRTLFEEVAERENGRVNDLIWTVWQNESSENHIGCEYGYVRDGQRAIISMTEIIISSRECFTEFTHAVNVLTSLYNEISGNDVITPEALEELGFIDVGNGEYNSPLGDGRLLYATHDDSVVYRKYDTESKIQYEQRMNREDKLLFTLNHKDGYIDLEIDNLTKLKTLLQILGVGGE